MSARSHRIVATKATFYRMTGERMSEDTAGAIVDTLVSRKARWVTTSLGVVTYDANRRPFRWHLDAGPSTNGFTDLSAVHVGAKRLTDDEAEECLTLRQNPWWEL